MLFKEDAVARADAEAIRKGIGFYRWTHDLVEITGRDALEVLQKIYISDLSKVPVGKSKYTASLDENGEIIDDVIVMHMGEGLYWVSDLYGPRPVSYTHLFLPYRVRFRNRYRENGPAGLRLHAPHH